MGWLDRIASKINAELQPQTLSEDERGQLALALAYLDRGDLKDAEDRLRPLLAQHPRRADVLMAAGRLAWAQNDLEQAVVLFGRAVDGAPETTNAWLSLCELLLLLRRYEPALDAARKVMLLAENATTLARAHWRGQALWLQGRVALAQERMQDARRLLEEARAHGVADADVAADLARALLAQNAKDAASWFLLAAKQPGASVDLVLQAARLQTDALVAIDVLRSAISRSQAPQDLLRLHGCLAYKCVLRGDDEAAAASLDVLPAADLDAVDHASSAELAYAYAHLGRYAQALAWAARAGTKINADLQLLWALGNQDKTALGEFAIRIEAQQPTLAALLSSAFANPPNIDSLLHILAKAPANTRRFWANHVAPPAPADTHAAALLQSFIETIKPLVGAADLAWAATRALAQIDRPLVVALLGEFNAGKSTLVNQLVGESLAPVGVKPTTATLNTFRHGIGGAHVLYRGATGRKTRHLTTAQVQPFLSTLSDEDAANIDVVEIFLPEPHLQHFEWVDTPGLNAPREAHERLTKRFMSSADLVIWVLSAQQAAKASEVAVLSELFEAHTPVLALLNKIDQVDDAELPAIRDSVAEALGKSIIAILPTNLRDPTAAQAGRAQVLQTLDDYALPRMLALKQRSALATLRKLIAEAQTLVKDSVPVEPAIPQHTDVANDIQRAGAGFDPTLFAAMGPLAQSLAEESNTDRVIETVVAKLSDVITGFVVDSSMVQDEGLFRDLAQRYVAQARGRLEGGLAEQFVRHRDGGERRRALELALPDPERFLWAPWRQARHDLAATRAAEHKRRLDEDAARKTLLEARFAAPLAVVQEQSERAWDELVRVSSASVSGPTAHPA
ncbi:MAG: dynamin family protein [Deltaproteobacteria bacterium]|nr:dynamin family protein [Deltaproteobacteria bacterium]